MTLLSSVSAPTSMMCKSAPPNPVPPIGLAITLTCIVYVELGPAVDIPVILNTVWTGPDEFAATNISQPTFGMSSTTFIISRAVISSFRRTQSGVYTCTGSLNASSSSINPYLIDGITTSELIQVTTGEIVSYHCTNFCLLIYLEINFTSQVFI